MACFTTVRSTDRARTDVARPDPHHNDKGIRFAYPSRQGLQGICWCEVPTGRAPITVNTDTRSSAHSQMKLAMLTKDRLNEQSTRFVPLKMPVDEWHAKPYYTTCFYSLDGYNPLRMRPVQSDFDLDPGRRSEELDTLGFSLDDLRFTAPDECL